MAEGFIKISRKIQEWEHFDNLALTGFWIHLLLHASWDKTKKLNPGEFYTTQESLAAECQIGRRTVVRYLQRLQESGEIKTETDHQRTKITITNWALYQNGTTTGTTPASLYHGGTTSGTTTGTTSGTTNDPAQPYLIFKEVKNRRMVTKPSLDQIREYIYTENLMVDPEKFFDYYESQGWKLSNGNRMKDWKAACRNWHRKEVEKMNKEKKGVLPF